MNNNSLLLRGTHIYICIVHLIYYSIRLPLCVRRTLYGVRRTLNNYNRIRDIIPLREHNMSR